VETLEERTFKLKRVRTRTGAVLWLIEISENHFFIEQNPKKNSKYGFAYRMLKQKYPEFYMFWEIKDDRYTGRLLAGAFLTKKEMDQVIMDLLKNDEFTRYEDVLEEL